MVWLQNALLRKKVAKKVFLLLPLLCYDRLMLRLGFPLRIVGCPALRLPDKHWGSGLQFSVKLIYLRDILRYLQRIDVHFYRLSPHFTSAFTPKTAFEQFQLCAAELEILRKAREAQNLRFTIHLEHSIALGSANEKSLLHQIAQIEVQALLLEHLGMQEEGVLVAHVGGKANDSQALARFSTHRALLSEAAQKRLVVEHDASSFSLGAALQLHQECGIPVVFDYLHWLLYNPEQIPLDLALGLALATWPTGVRPKIHLSTARSEAHLRPQARRQQILPPHRGQHADFVVVNDLMQILQAAKGLRCFDLMLEAKAGDLALLRLRQEMASLAPNLAAQLG